MTIYNLYTMEEITERVHKARCIALMIDHAGYMRDIADQFGEMPGVKPQIDKLLTDLRLLAATLSSDIDWMLWETTPQSPAQRADEDAMWEAKREEDGDEAEMPAMTAFYLIVGGGRIKIPLVRAIREVFDLSLTDAVKLINAADNRNVLVGFTTKKKALHLHDVAGKCGYIGAIKQPHDDRMAPADPVALGDL